MTLSFTSPYICYGISSVPCTYVRTLRDPYTTGHERHEGYSPLDNEFNYVHICYYDWEHVIY